MGSLIASEPPSMLIDMPQNVLCDSSVIQKFSEAGNVPPNVVSDFVGFIIDRQYGNL